MPDSKVNTEDLGAYIPRPKKVSEKRKMLAVYKDDYDQISEIATLLQTTRGRVITGLLAYYNDTE